MVASPSRNLLLLWGYLKLSYRTNVLIFTEHQPRRGCTKNPIFRTPDRSPTSGFMSVSDNPRAEGRLRTLQRIFLLPS
jgi:hypothetical protein